MTLHIWYKYTYKSYIHIYTYQCPPYQTYTLLIDFIISEYSLDIGL